MMNEISGVFSMVFTGDSLYLLPLPLSYCAEGINRANVISLQE
jgi:hypothetical protein